MGIGFELVVLVLAGAYLGKYLDDYFGVKSYFTAGLIVVLMVSWFYHLLFVLNKMNQEDEN